LVHALAVALRGDSAVAIATAELPHLVVQGPHRLVAKFNPFLPFLPLSPALYADELPLLVCKACPVSVSVRPER
jgi:hypothetical protein